jgi:methyl-accepting chemotaxis protein
MFLFGREARQYRELMDELRTVCRRAAQGDFAARIVHTKPFGKLADVPVALNRLLDLTDAFVRESGASLQFASQGKFFRPFMLRGMLGDFRRGAGTINDARLSMKGRTEEAEHLAAVERQRQAQEQAARSERLAHADSFQQNVATIAGSVQAAGQQLADSATAMRGEIDAMRASAESAAVAAVQATSNTSTVAEAAQLLAASVAKVSGQAAESRAASEAVASELERAGQAVADLATANRKIDEVTEFIRAVSFQTNLLALNASVEAARAGAAGSGFAVVAQEVRQLAHKTTEAAKSIAEQIGAIRQASDRTIRSIEEIRGQAHGLNGRVVAISDAVREQAASTADISNNIQAAAERTEQVSTNIVKVSAAAGHAAELADGVKTASAQLSDTSEVLGGKVGEFLAYVREI